MSQLEKTQEAKSIAIIGYGGLAREIGSRIKYAMRDWLATSIRRL